MIKIWDLKEKANVANFPGHSGPITSISFSENGQVYRAQFQVFFLFLRLCRYYLASSAEDSLVKLWDLRKLKNFKTLSLPEGYVVKAVTFDQSGTYLGIAGSDIR